MRAQLFLFTCTLYATASVCLTDALGLCFDVVDERMVCLVRSSHLLIVNVPSLI